MTQTKISSDCSALLQQQTVNIDQFRNIIIDYELSCPYTVHTTKPDNPSLIAYMGSLLAGDGTYLFLNLTHSPATRNLTLYCTVAHTCKANGWAALFGTEICHVLNDKTMC
jgi:hypothetical protein